MKIKKINIYSEILKNTTLYGGIQVFIIIIGLLKSKLIAIFLGPVGIGINGLFQSNISLISSVSNFGLHNTAIKNISQNVGASNKELISKQISIFKRLFFWSGILSFILTISFSSYLSYTTFGNYDYIYSFILLSFSLLLMQISIGNNIILQATQNTRYVVSYSLLSNILGLFVAIPFYIILGNDGIIFSIISGFFINFIISSIYVRKICTKAYSLSFSDFKETIKDVKNFGLVIGIAGLITMLTAHVLKLFITRSSDLVALGLFNAGFSIVGNYVGLIFSAMSNDYFPKLSSLSSNKSQFDDLVNKQTEISLLILAPLIFLFIVYINPIIILFYSKTFLPIERMIFWASLGMFFKALSWSVAYIFLAKGRSKLFLYNETLASTYIFLINLYFYNKYGLTGLGLSFLIAYSIYSAHIILVSKYYFNFKLSTENIKIFSINIVFFILLVLTYNISENYKSLVILSLLLLTFLFNIIKLHQKVDVIHIIFRKLTSRF